MKQIIFMVGLALCFAVMASTIQVDSQDIQSDATLITSQGEMTIAPVVSYDDIHMSENTMETEVLGFLSHGTIVESSCVTRSDDSVNLYGFEKNTKSKNIRLWRDHLGATHNRHPLLCFS